jgi:hypothetical protein
VALKGREGNTKTIKLNGGLVVSKERLLKFHDRHGLATITKDGRIVVWLPRSRRGRDVEIGRIVQL